MDLDDFLNGIGAKSRMMELGREGGNGLVYLKLVDGDD